MVVIDGRQIAVEEVFKMIKKAFSEQKSLEDTIEVIVNTREDAKKVKAFCLMSGGCKVESRREGTFFVLRVVDRYCRCGDFGV